MDRHSVADSFRGLMAAVISRALDDLKQNIHAMDIDYKTIRERGAALCRRFLERAA